MNKNLPKNDVNKYRLIVDPVLNGNIVSGHRVPETPEQQAERLAVPENEYFFSTDFTDWYSCTWGISWNPGLF